MEERSEFFWVVDSMGATCTHVCLKDAKEEAIWWVKMGSWVKVFHLDIDTSTMTLVKEYRRKPTEDEEELIEYV